MLLFNIILTLVIYGVNSEKSCSPIFKTIGGENVTNIEEYCKNQKCVTKCCKENEGLISNSDTYRCEKIDAIKKLFNTESALPYYDYRVFDSNKNVTEKRINKEDFNILELVNMQCLFRGTDCGYELTSLDFKCLLEDGIMTFLNADYVQETASPSQYCMDTYHWQDKAKGKETYKSKYAFFLIDPQYNDSNTVKDLTIGFMKLISVFFLLLILVAYWILQKYYILQGMVIMAYVGTLMLSYLLSATCIFAYDHLLEDHHVIIMPVYYFLTLSSFFWLNTMCFDIWYTISIHTKRQNFNVINKNMTFLMYTAYASGLPLLMTIFAIVMEQMSKDYKIIRPKFKHGFVDPMPTFLYLYIPVIVLTFVNIMLFILTMYNIFLIKKSYQFVNDCRQQRNNQTFFFYVKVALVMGGSWLTELVLANPFKVNNDLPMALFILLIFCNCLMGFILFIILICKRSILIPLCEKCNISAKYLRHLGLDKTFTRYTAGTIETTNLTKLTTDDSGTAV